MMTVPLSMVSGSTLDRLHQAYQTQKPCHSHHALSVANFHSNKAKQQTMASMVQPNLISSNCEKY